MSDSEQINLLVMWRLLLHWQW